MPDLAGCLRTVEEAFEEPPSSMQLEGNLYITEEEWAARRTRCEVENPGAGGSGGDGGSGDNRGDDRGRNDRGHGCRRGSGGHRS
jgi:hypothetical protein